MKTRYWTLQYIYDYIENNGYPPNYQEIAAAVGIGPLSIVEHQINQLVQEGYLARGEFGSGRTLTVTLAGAEKVSDCLQGTFLHFAPAMQTDLDLQDYRLKYVSL